MFGLPESEVSSWTQRPWPLDAAKPSDLIASGLRLGSGDSVPPLNQFRRQRSAHAENADAKKGQYADEIK